jgi:hypothetical protein
MIYSILQLLCPDEHRAYHQQTVSPYLSTLLALTALIAFMILIQLIQIADGA